MSDPMSVLIERIGQPIEPGLLEQALTHRSFAYERGGLPTNERLEFLGDAVLGLVITEALYRQHPDLPEGQLAKIRSGIVNMRALADIARELELGRCIRLGRGEASTGGPDKNSILADALEAVVGAIYLEHGLDVTAAVIQRLFGPLIEDAATRGAGLDWKTSLQELAAAESLGVPEYVVEGSGPDHDKSFHAVVVLAGQPRGAGAGRSKKEAEQQAAEAAFHALRAPARTAQPEVADATPSA